MSCLLWSSFCILFFPGSLSFFSGFNPSSLLSICFYWVDFVSHCLDLPMPALLSFLINNLFFTVFTPIFVCPPFMVRYLFLSFPDSFSLWFFLVLSRYLLQYVSSWFFLYLVFYTYSLTSCSHFLSLPLFDIKWFGLVFSPYFYHTIGFNLVQSGNWILIICSISLIFYRSALIWFWFSVIFPSL